MSLFLRTPTEIWFTPWMRVVQAPPFDLWNFLFVSVDLFAGYNNAILKDANTFLGSLTLPGLEGLGSRRFEEEFPATFLDYGIRVRGYLWALRAGGYVATIAQDPDNTSALGSRILGGHRKSGFYLGVDMFLAGFFRPWFMADHQVSHQGWVRWW